MSFTKDGLQAGYLDNWDSSYPVKSRRLDILSDGRTLAKAPKGRGEHGGPGDRREAVWRNHSERGDLCLKYSEKVNWGRMQSRRGAKYVRVQRMGEEAGSRSWYWKRDRMNDTFWRCRQEAMNKTAKRKHFQQRHMIRRFKRGAGRRQVRL